MLTAMNRRIILFIPLNVFYKHELFFADENDEENFNLKLLYAMFSKWMNLNVSYSRSDLL